MLGDTEVYYPALRSPLWSQTTQFKIQVLTMMWVKTQILAVKLQQETGLTNRLPVKPSIITYDCMSCTR